MGSTDGQSKQLDWLLNTLCYPQSVPKIKPFCVLIQGMHIHTQYISAAAEGQ